MTLTPTNLAGIALTCLLLGGTLAHYGVKFLAWTDQRRRRRAAIEQALRDCAPVYDWASDDLWADFQATEPKR